MKPARRVRGEFAMSSIAQGPGLDRLGIADFVALFCIVEARISPLLGFATYAASRAALRAELRRRDLTTDRDLESAACAPR
jgi:hypothetical protein